MAEKDGLDRLKVNISEIDKAKLAIVRANDALEQLRETLQNNATQMLLSVAKKAAEAAATVDFSCLIKNFCDVIIPLKYIYLLQELKWPLFLINDEKLRRSIMDACAKENDIETVKNIVFDYFTDEYLQKMEEDWAECEVIAAERHAIFKEALTLHKLGYYYASTSMLMCQVYGVAADVINWAKINNLKLDKEGKEFVADFFKIDMKFIDKEKGRLLQMTVMTENAQMLWEAMAEYLQKEILCSENSPEQWKTQPLRNKICHGEQLNFGTKEHSLKAILTIDMLVQLAYEINRVCKNMNSDIAE